LHRNLAISSLAANCYRGLVKVMTDGIVQASARVSEARALLKFSREALELDALAARIEALERDGQRVGAHAGVNSRW
jgi:hypothetical protein